MNPFQRARPAHRHKAFTLVETLVAFSLALLMVGIVAGTIARFQSRIDAARAQTLARPWHEILRHQLQCDYCHCRSVIVEPDRLVFDGYSRVVNSSGYLASEPVRIVYQIHARARESWLIRYQDAFLAPLDDRLSTSAVCQGVQRFELRSRLDTDVPPGCLALRIWLFDPGSSATDPKPIQLALFRHGVPE